MKDLYIVGAGGFGREVYSWLQDEGTLIKENHFRGFLDDNSTALDGFDLDAGIVGSVSEFSDISNAVFICGIGTVSVKRELCADLRRKGAKFLRLIHPTVIMGRNVQLGEGVVLCPRVTLTCDIRVGDMAMINCHSSAGHDAVIGNWTTISAHCDLTGASEIGDGAFLGSGCRLLPTKKVGDGAIVGPGSVVMRNVPAGARVLGSPAREF
jgi:sugar O-acyltransferase (sialic acid O-acetyltransferase NeuD family)